jgi:hypothetical protein
MLSTLCSACSVCSVLSTLCSVCSVCSVLCALCALCSVLYSLRTDGRAIVVWEVRRTDTWDILLVSSNGIKSTRQLASRGQNDDGSVSSEFAMSRSKEDRLWVVGLAIEADRDVLAVQS